MRSDFTTIFEKSDGYETATYEETIQFYSDLAESFKEISFREIGETDSGKPLHLVTYNSDAEFDFESIRILKPGQYELDLVNIFKKRPLIYKLEEGKYMIDLPESFRKSRED